MDDPNLSIVLYGRLQIQIARNSSDSAAPVHLRIRRVREGGGMSRFYTLAGGGGAFVGGVDAPHSEQTPLVLPVRS